MTLLIVHLSDIHFRDATDVVLKRAEAIVAGLRPSLPNAKCIAIVVSGDIANTGASSEYSLATRFLNDLAARLKKEKKVPTYTVLAPGNHDCDFRGDQAARNLVIAEILKQPNNLAESYLQTTLKVQSEFQSFRRKHENKDILSFDDRLWTSYKFSIEGFKVVFDVLNASWMSTRHEQQGGLYFPFERFIGQADTSSDFRVAVLHHPLNWYSQSNYRAFRSFLHTISDMVLTGHEHEGAAREVDDATDGRCIYIEGEALQTVAGGQSAFNIILVDGQAREFKAETLRFLKGRYEPEKPELWDSFRPIAKKSTTALAFNTTFTRDLTDPGATLRHFSGRDLVLEDFYVYPDLDDRSQKDDSKKVKAARPNASSLMRAEKLTSDVVIQGDDESGKTRLLYRLAAEFLARGKAPLILRGEAIKSASASSVASEIRKAVEGQYRESDQAAFAQTVKTDKILLIDDFDMTPLNPERRSALLSALREHVGRIILTVGENFEVAELFGGEDILGFEAMKNFKILPFGHARRLELVRKWNRIGISESTSENEFLKSCDEAERLIESTKLRFVASTSPIFILSLLQATSSGAASELHNSSFAHYYYFLILGALEKAKVSKDRLNLILSVCTRLSWFIRVEGLKQKISLAQFRTFIRQYSLRWTSIDEEEVLLVLTHSRLFEVSGDAFYFTYPYSYYYFLGRYASVERDSGEVKEYVDYCLNHLYVRECANTLLFLAHHNGNSYVLDRVTKAIDEHFADKLPASLASDDIESIRGLLAHAPALKYKEIKPSTFRDEQAARQDISSGSDGLAEEPSNTGKNLLHEVVGISKAIEIAGTLLTHQYANYDRTTKNAAIRSMFDGAMRTVKTFHGHLERVDNLLYSIKSKVKNRRDGTSDEQQELHLRNVIAILLKAITTTFIIRAGANLQTQDLSENISEVISQNPTCAYQLIKLSQDLQRPVRIPRLEIDRLRKTEGSNPAVMGVLQLLILNRLNAYETGHDDKDWAMGVFELTGQRNLLAGPSR